MTPKHDTKEARKNQIYRFIVGYKRENDEAPQLQEIAAAVGLGQNAVARYMKQLEDDGKIKRSGKMRGVEIIEDNERG